MASTINENKESTSSLASSSPSTTTSHAGDNEISKLSAKILKAYQQLAFERGIHSYELSGKPISGVGENSYGLIMQMDMRARDVKSETEGNVKAMETATNMPLSNILKISPKNPAFRAHSRIKELYQREVLMYKLVFPEFRTLYAERMHELQKQQLNCDSHCKCFDFNIVPDLMYSCLEAEDEFLIFEDLTLSGYKQNERTKMPSVDLAAATFRSIGKFHAMSFVLQSRKPLVFYDLIQQIDDNLFIENIEPITIEFGKKYIRKTRVMLEQDSKQTSSASRQIEALQKLEDNFTSVCMNAVNGKACAPYAVICHGDFWNNNMLYEFDASNNTALSAKLIDFQLSRYAAPVLDLMHYLCTSTDRDLRKQHFTELIETYFQSLSSHIEFYGLNVEEIYPKNVFMQQLRDYGVFGLCMAAFSIPFFISNTSEIPDLDEVATAIREISSSENSDMEEEEVNEKNNNGLRSKSDADHKRQELLNEYDLLSERTLPIFRRRMFDIIKDLEKYEMLDGLLKL